MVDLSIYDTFTCLTTRSARYCRGDLCCNCGSPVPAIPSVTPIGYEAAWPGATRVVDWFLYSRLIQMQNMLCAKQDLINFLREKNGEQADAIVKLKKEIRDLKGRLRQYEHFNISGDTIYNAERDAWRRKTLGAGSKSGDVIRN